MLHCLASGALVLLSCLPHGAAATRGLAERAEDHVEHAVAGGLEPTDFHHLVLALRWRASLPDWTLTDRLLERLSAAGGDPLMADEVRLYRARVAVEEGRPAAAHELHRAMGGLEQWWVHGPRGFEELADLTLVATAPDATMHWRPASGTDPLGWVRLVGVAWPAQRQLVYLASTVASESEQPAAVRIGVAQAARVWLNGHELMTVAGPLEHAQDQVAAGCWLRRGRNTLVVAVASENEDWWLRVRLTTPEGETLPGVHELGERPQLETAGGARGPASRPAPAVRTLEADIQDAVTRGEDGAELALAAYMVTRRPHPVGSGEARAACRAARRQAPAAARYLEWLITNEPAAAQQLLTEALDEDPGLHWPRVALAEWYHERGLYERAAATLRVAGDEPAARAAQLNLDADLWGRMVLPAIADVSRSAPRCVEAAMVLATRAMDGRTWGMVHEALDRLQAVVPGSAHTASLREAVAESCGDGEALRAVLHDLLALDPNRPRLRVRLARLEAAAEAFDLARSLLEDGLARCPDHPDISYELARLEHATGDDERAVALARRLIELRPQDRRARRLLELLGEGEDEDSSWRRTPEELWRLADAAPEASPAVVVVQHSEVHFRRGNLTEERVQRAILITAAEQADAYLQHTLPYVPERQRLRVLAARILRRDGSEVSARRRDTPRLADPELNMYYDTRLHVLDFRELADGELVELSYVLTETAEANETGPYKGGLTVLGHDAPVALAEFELAGPEDLLPAWELVGLEGEPERIAEPGRGVRLVWTWHNLPAVPRDVPPAPVLLRAPHVVYSNHGDWGQLADWYARHVAPRIRASREIEDTAERLTRGVDDRSERIARVYRFVTNEIRYVGLELGEHRFRPFSADWVVNHGIGDCKDKAALLVALYGVLGIDARMVLVRTSDIGPVRGSLALLESFNHAIVYLPDDDLWLDGTAAGHDLTLPPPVDQGAWVLVVDGPDSRPQTTPVVGAGVSVMRYRLERAGEGVVAIDLRVEDTGDAASLRRSRFSGRADTRRLARWLQRQFPGAELIGEPVIRLQPGRDPTVIELRATVQRTALTSGGGLKLFPEGLDLVSALAPGGERSGPLQVPLRSDLEWSLEVETGRAAADLPASVRLETAYGRLVVEVEGHPTGYRVEGRFHLEAGLVPAGQAAELREFLVAVERQVVRPVEVP